MDQLQQTIGCLEHEIKASTKVKESACTQEYSNIGIRISFTVSCIRLTNCLNNYVYGYISLVSSLFMTYQLSVTVGCSCINVLHWNTSHCVFHCVCTHLEKIWLDYWNWNMMVVPRMRPNVSHLLSQRRSRMVIIT